MLLSILLIFLVTREKRTESNEFFLRLNHRMLLKYVTTRFGMKLAG